MTNADRARNEIVLEKPDAIALANQRPSSLSATDEVCEATLVPAWTKFADLSIEQKFEQAKLMTFDEREAYLRERCLAARLEVASAASALERATAIIEANLPFFLVHFQELDAHGHRSDLKGKVMGKTEWLAQNMPNISRGTFYNALSSVKSRLAEQNEMLDNGSVKPEQRNGVSPTDNSGFQRKSKRELTQSDLNRLTESAKKAEADIQRGKALNIAELLAEHALDWCKVCAEQVRADSRLLQIAQYAQATLNAINDTHNEFVLPPQGAPQGSKVRGIPP